MGKDLCRRNRVAALLGAHNRFRLGERLHRVTAELRQPFLDFVADMGRHQEDAIGWWSSAFSWKVSGASDLFLLICYLHVARGLLREAAERGNGLILVVEDPWLLRQIEEGYPEARNVQFIRAGGLWRHKFRAGASGLLRRLWWLSRVLRHRRRQQRVFPASAMTPPSCPTAAVYTLPMARSLRPDGGWEDPILPNMDRFLRELGYKVIRFSPPEKGGFEREIAERCAIIRPLILYATPAGIYRSLLALWRPRWPNDLTVGGASVRRLAEREWWMDVARSNWCVYRLFYECLRKMLAAGDWRWIIYPYENQPWEKMIALCARERGVRAAGVQHSSLSVFYMSYFLGSGEAAQMPLPDVICTSGPYPQKVLAEGGNPVDRLKMWGSIRYAGVTGDGAKNTPTLIRPAPRSEILVALPIEIDAAKHLLAAIRSAFPSGGREEGIHFHIKEHPSCPIDSSEVGFSAARAPRHFTEALDRCGLVVFIGTTVGPEAAAVGRTVVRYRSELLLNVDPSEVYGDDIPTCTDDTFREVVLNAVANERGSSSREASQNASRQVFSPLSRDLVDQIFQLS